MDLAMLLLLSCAIILAINSAAGSACSPMISIGSNSKPDIGGHLFLECEISTCTDVNMIVYERTGIGTNKNWIPVYECFNKTYHHALETGTNYTLERRNDYTAFPTKHILYVQDLIFMDHGEWRCALINGNQNYVSSPFEVTVYVTPRKDSISILLNTTALVEEQTSDLICLVEGIHPQPDVIWTLNGGEYVHGTAADIQREDGLWKVHNTIRLSFNTIGKNVVNCIMTKKGLALLRHTNISLEKFPHGDVWLEDKIDIDVKESAKILYPQEDVNITENADSTFTLNCNGSGYRPNLTWTKDGVHIKDNDRTYTIRHQCNDYFCCGSLTQLSVHEMPCLDSNVYKCIISLELPYQSTQISSKFKVYGKGKTCYPNYRISMITILSVIIGIVIVVGSITGVLVYYKKRTQNIPQTALTYIDSTSSTPKTARKTSLTDENDTKSISNLHDTTTLQNGQSVYEGQYINDGYATLKSKLHFDQVSVSSADPLHIPDVTNELEKNVIM